MIDTRPDPTADGCLHWVHCVVLGMVGYGGVWWGMVVGFPRAPFESRDCWLAVPHRPTTCSIFANAGETHELREELNSPNRDKKKDAVKKVSRRYDIHQSVRGAIPGQGSLG